MRKIKRFATVACACVLATGAIAPCTVLAESGDTAVFTSETRLDLRLGDVTQILSAEQLEQALGTDLLNVEAPGEEQMEQIEVHATREQYEEVRSNIPFGFASIAWALQNPAEGWRILFPVQLDG